MVLAGDESLIKLLQEHSEIGQIENLIDFRTKLQEKTAEPVSSQITRKT